MDKIHEFGELPVMALLRNSETTLENTSKDGFEAVLNIAVDLAGFDKQSSKSFLDTIPQHAGKLDMNEVREWKNKGISSFPNNKNALRAFIPASIELGKHTEETSADTRSILVDRGIRLADIQPESVKSYFENAVPAYNLLSSELFEEWCETGEGISLQDPEAGSSYYVNSVIPLSKISPEFHEEILRISNMLLVKEGALCSIFFENLSHFIEKTNPENAGKWAETGLQVYKKDRKLAFDYFSNSPSVLEKLDMDELEEWTLKGLQESEEKTPALEAYFNLESKRSNEYVEELTGSVALRKVANVLRFYALGLSGANYVIRSMATLPLQMDAQGMNPIIAGKTIYLAPKMGIYEDTEDNFRIYKLSVMHEVGHLKFSSLGISPENARSLREKTSIYPDTPDANTENPDIVDILSLFPNPIIAATLMGILEDARVEHLIMEHYRGVRSDLEEVRKQMLMMRLAPENGLDEFMEALLWVTTGTEPVFETDRITTQLIEDIRQKIMEELFRDNSTTISSLNLAFYIYERLEEYFGPLEKTDYKMIKNIAYRGMDIGATGPTDPMMTKPSEDVIKNFIPETEADLTAQEERPKEQATNRPTQAFNKNWKVLGSYKYDEWDSLINDYRSEWSTVNEIEPVGGSTAYYNKVMKRYGNEIALLKHTFSMMKPEAFHRLKEQNDGTEIDIDAFTESLIAKKSGINPDENLYIRWDKHERDVATLFLMDVSASTRKILGADGRSILDVEKEALIIMSQALESIGDKYAIYAFSGKSREDVEYFFIKDFDEKLSDNVALRISLLQPTSNTRLGPSIRHSVKKLETAGARTKMLVLLSDGEPYDRSGSEDSYQGNLAQEDTRVAISEGKNRGMHFFCITVDKNPGDYLDNIFSDVGYTIIDDALMLPETLPLLYKRLTT
ncbi:MAG: hypothetical protein R2741_10485 [Methanolobus sp.]